MRVKFKGVVILRACKNHENTVYISYFDINLEQCANVGHYWYGTYYAPYMEYGTYLSKSSDQSKL